MVTGTPRCSGLLSSPGRFFFKMNIFSFFGKKRSSEEHVVSSVDPTSSGESIVIDVDLTSIENGIAYSSTSNAIALAFKRHGINALVNNTAVYTTEYIYEPVSLSDHWKFYINSKKVKPKKLEYLKVKTNK